MGSRKLDKSVHGRISDTLEHLETLMGAEAADLPDGHATETVEEAMRRLKGKLPDKQLRQLGD
ncbi:MAG TPA: hypothetical protein VK196_20100 [Magnetospirillum sp.]|nr:hypothetical protein [Magnetospirillum sp.]